MPRVVPLRRDISADELRRRAEQEPDGRAARRMLALAAVLDGASREETARLQGWTGRASGTGTIGSTRRASRGSMIARTRGGRRG
jgi:hypothetical protein